jgi:hypothetical protein
MPRYSCPNWASCQAAAAAERREGRARHRILECAVAGRAQAIVTDDKALLALGEYSGVRIISLRDYLNE